MTTEEKARAYDKALKRLKPLYEQAKKDDNPIWSTYEYLVPELAESEDDRIRKDIIALIKFGLTEGSAVSPGSRTTKEEALAWLEKQPAWSEEDEIMIGSLINYFEGDALDCSLDCVVNWLKSLRPQPKQKINNMITPNKEFFQWIYDRLVNVHKEDPNVDYMMSFKRRIEELSFDEPSWKPSEEQMETLDIVISDYRHACTKGSDKKAEILKPLLEQLRKL